MRKALAGAVLGLLAVVTVAGVIILVGQGATPDAALPPTCKPPCGLPTRSGTSSATESGTGTTTDATTDTVTKLPASSDHLVFGDPDTSGLAEWPEQFDVAPKVYDLDGDGTEELIMQSNDTNVYVFSAEGRALARLPTTSPPDWYIERILNTAEAGVLRPGEPASIVVTNHAAYVSVWRVVPHMSHALSMQFELQWEVRMTECFWNPGMDAKPTLADLDGDGTLEILVQTEEVGFYALNADGTTLWSQCWAGGNAALVAADLDNDGKPEVIVASDSGLLAVFVGKTGAPLWTFDASQYVTPGSIPVEPSVAELDGTGEKEVVFIARVAPDPDPATWQDAHMAIFAVHRNPATWQAELLWMRQPDWANPLSYTRLATPDLDGDGISEIFGMDWNTVGHHPGNWERLGPAHVFRLAPDGSDVWVQELDTWWSNKDIAIGDTDGDGRLEVLANGPAPTGFDSIVSLDVQTGEPLHYLGVPGWQVMRGVTLTDLRHDGRMQVVFPVAPSTGPMNGALLVFELDVPYNAPWKGNQ